MKVTINNKQLEVKKLPLKKYVELLKGLQELPKHLASLSGLSNEEVFAKLPDLVAAALPDVVRVVSLATDLEEQEIYTLGLDEVVDLFIAVIEVNKYIETFSKIKKALVQPK